MDIVWQLGFDENLQNIDYVSISIDQWWLGKYLNCVGYFQYRDFWRHGSAWCQDINRFVDLRFFSEYSVPHGQS